MSEFSMMSEGSGVIGICGFLDGTKSTYKFPFTINPYSDMPKAACFIPMNSFVAGGIAALDRLIVSVLFPCALSQIIAAIVERIVIFMVSFLSWSTSKDKAMHVNGAFRWFPSGDKSRSVERLLREPSPLRQPVEISSVNDYVLASCKRNQSVGWIKRLDNFMPWQRLEAHVLTSHENVFQPRLYGNNQSLKEVKKEDS